VGGFDDRNGYYPGLELRPDGRVFFRDVDASVVLPSQDNCVYTTRFVDPAGNPLPDFYGIDLLETGSVLGTGRPAGGSPVDMNPKDPTNPCKAGRDLSFGVRFDVKNVGKDNKYATISVDPGPKK
jgi:immune inhibitor A